MNSRTRDLVIFIASILCFHAVLSHAGILSESTAASQIQIGTRSTFFACELYNEGKVDCPKSNAEILGFVENAESGYVSRIFTEDANYVPGLNGSVLKIDPHLAQYFEMSKEEPGEMDHFSISFWATDEADHPEYSHVISFTNPENNKGWVFDYEKTGKDHDGVTFSVFNTEGVRFSPPSVPLSKMNPTNIIGTFDGKNVRIYNNGILHGSVAFTGSYDGSPRVHLKIGEAAYSTDYHWAGTLADLWIFGRALNGTEVRALLDGKPSSENLIGHWKFDGNLRDSSGHGNDMVHRIQTVSMQFAPDGRLFYTIKNTGEIKYIEKGIKEPVLFANLSRISVGDHDGLLGIAIDPQFTSNHFIYVFATIKNVTTGKVQSEIVRYTERNGTGINPTTIFRRIPASSFGIYAGGAIAFGPDGYLYVTVGMGDNPQQSQNITSWSGKILRIEKNGGIPPDNPIPGSPVYAMGLRNSYGIAFSSLDGKGIITENGDKHDDKVDVISKGADYGFPFGFGNYTSNSFHREDPVRDYYKVIAPTQAAYYNANAFAGLKNQFLMGSFDNGRLYALDIGHGKVNEVALMVAGEFPDNIIAIAPAPNGSIYFGGYDIHKLILTDQGSKVQDVFSVGTNTSSSVSINSLTFSSNETKLTLNLTSNNTLNPEALEFKIPKIVLSGIYRVNMSSIDQNTGELKQKDLPYSVKFERGGLPYILVSVKFSGTGNSLVSLVGTKSVRSQSIVPP